MGEWRNMQAVELGDGIAAGTIDPVELAEAFLEAIAAEPAGPDIYARTTPDRARAEAQGARDRARAGLRRGPLDGVPLSWKDLVDTAGTATEAGTALLQGRVPRQDAEVLRRATAAGTVCLGKTHMTELAFAGIGYNPVTATPPNRQGAHLAPGGSSSGAAASVALGLAPAAIGSDTGGSVRVPAAWNDLVGLKTTAGQLPLEGVVPLAESFDTIGPLARSVADAAAVYAVLSGRPAPDLRGARLAGRRLAILRTAVMEDLAPEIAEGYARALDRLASAGAALEEIDVPAVAEALPLSGALYTGEAYGTWREMIEARPEIMFPEIRDRFRAGGQFSAADYVSAWRALRAARADWARAVAGFDAVLCPTTPNLPPEIARLTQEEGYYREQNLLTLRNTRVGNLMGLAVLTLPTGTPAVGLSLMGAPQGEAALLRLGAAAEAALG